MYQVGLMETDTHVQYFWNALEIFSQVCIYLFIFFYIFSGQCKTKFIGLNTRVGKLLYSSTKLFVVYTKYLY